MKLQPGDVLLHKDRTPSFGARGIRLITGSKYTHCSLVLPDGSILEQGLKRRIHFGLKAYCKKTLTQGESLELARPKFEPRFNYAYVTTGDFYGWNCIVDALINHGLGRVADLFGCHYTYKPWLSRFWGLDCSALVASASRLDECVAWCYENRIVEPDDFANHPESYELLGELDV